MALYSPEVYEPMHARYTKEQCHNGGVKRAQTARRDKFGRMLPNNDTVSMPEPTNHGVAGGLKRSATAKRNKGKFAK